MNKYEQYRQTTYDNYVLFSRPMNTEKKWRYETESDDFETIQIEICDIVYNQTPVELPLEFKVVEIPAEKSLKPYRFKEMYIKTTLAKAVEYLREKELI